MIGDCAAWDSGAWKREKKQESAQAKACIMLLNIRIFAARDDFFQPIPYLCLWGRMASCGRLEIGMLSISRKLRQAD